jgi:hypothetical protein
VGFRFSLLSSSAHSVPPFVPERAVVQVVRRREELVLAHVEPFALAQVHRHALARHRLFVGVEILGRVLLAPGLAEDGVASAWTAKPSAR